MWRVLDADFLPEQKFDVAEGIGHEVEVAIANQLKLYQEKIGKFLFFSLFLPSFSTFFSFLLSFSSFSFSFLSKLGAGEYERADAALQFEDAYSDYLAWTHKVLFNSFFISFLFFIILLWM
jgi:hypothetical protein